MEQAGSINGQSPGLESPFLRPSSRLRSLYSARKHKPPLCHYPSSLRFIITILQPSSLTAVHSHNLRSSTHTHTHLSCALSLRTSTPFLSLAHSSHSIANSTAPTSAISSTRTFSDTAKTSARIPFEGGDLVVGVYVVAELLDSTKDEVFDTSYNSF